MQPKASLVETQQALAQAVRLGSADPLNGYAPRRLAVYARLVRNNTFGFIDRCYIEAPQHITPAQWDDTKETFVKEGKAHSPYFQDIAGEFLAFCQARQVFPQHVLDLMDFEHTQLLAEVAMANVPEEFEWDRNTVMQFSQTAYLKQYEIDFFSSQFRQFEENPTQLVIWRDSDFSVNQQSLSELDFWLLSYLQEQPSALEEVLSALNTIVDDSTPLIPLLEQTWVKWVNAEVIYPKAA
ncbi:DNA-binding domain-containing protein [Pasteurella sp. PK-2025]|uniref:HvfC family RiPP maturation protein n=1 Tax=Pasteurella sp. PK-2025 TaxID=3413133 RepID=UPI003C786E70